MGHKLITRETALRLKLRRYYTGKPCILAGHVAERYTETSGCVLCVREAKKDAKLTPDPEMDEALKKQADAARKNRYYLKNKKAFLERSKEHQERNREARNLKAKKYREKYKERERQKREEKMKALKEQKAYAEAQELEMLLFKKKSGLLKSKKEKTRLRYILNKDTMRRRNLEAYHKKKAKGILPTPPTAEKKKEYQENRNRVKEKAKIATENHEEFLRQRELEKKKEYNRIARRKPGEKEDIRDSR